MSKDFVFMQFRLKSHVDRFTKLFDKATNRATAKLVKMVERDMKKLTPYRHGTNQRSIFSKSKGNSGFITANSGYSFWLEVLDRVYEFGERLYMATSYENNKKKYEGLIRKEFKKLVGISTSALGLLK